MGEGDTVTISRNRKGDFIIYTTEPTTIRYLDHQAQADYLSRGGELKLGHFSLLKQPSDYEQVARSSNETYGQRSTDRILYAGTITWRHDGKALFYNNDCSKIDSIFIVLNQIDIKLYNVLIDSIYIVKPDSFFNLNIDEKNIFKYDFR